MYSAAHLPMFKSRANGNQGIPFIVAYLFPGNLADTPNPSISEHHCHAVTNLHSVRGILNSICSHSIRGFNISNYRD